MKHTVCTIVASTLALAACSQIGAGEPDAWRPYGPRYGPGPGYGMMERGAPGWGMRGPGAMVGPGFMGGWGGLPADLTADQRRRIAEIQREQRSRQWPLMQQMHELLWAAEAGEVGVLDEQAQRRRYDSLLALEKQMFENMLESRKRIEAVLTPQQREELRRDWRAGR